MMMHTVGAGGGGMAAASTIQINLFGPHPILLFGTEGDTDAENYRRLVGRPGEEVRQAAAAFQGADQ